MSFNYLTNSSGFTRITAYVGQLLDGGVNGGIRKALSTAASRSGQQGPKSPMRTERAYVADDRSLSVRQVLLH